MAVASDAFNDRHDGVVRLYSLPPGRPLGRALRFPAVADISLSPDGRLLTATRPTDGGVSELCGGQTALERAGEDSNL